MWRALPRTSLTFLFTFGCAACGAVTPFAPSAVTPAAVTQRANQASGAIALTAITRFPSFCMTTRPGDVPAVPVDQSGVRAAS